MDSKSWTVWGLEASITVTDSGLASAAESLVRDEIAGIDDACSRFRKDSELVRLQPELSAGTTVSPLLATLVACALAAATWTDGDVDPTLGRDLEALGYDRDLAEVRLDPRGTVIHAPRTQQRTPGWNQVRLVGRNLSVPEHLRLDLGATAKAVAADHAAQRAAAELECGILLSLGGDIATAGPAPEGGWQVLVQDLTGDPRQQVTLRAGHALATSSTQKRRWQHAGGTVHHILDPRFGLPAEPVWRSASVAAPSCLQANAFSTAAIVRGLAAVEWFDRAGIAARLVDARGRVSTTAGWPKDGNQYDGESMSVKAVESHG